MATTLISGVQYSGIWTMQQVNAAVAAGTWPSPPVYKLYGWGSNASGQLGLGNTTSYSSPKQVGTLVWSSTASGQSFTLAIKSDNTLWSWGNNSSGQLGLGNTTNYSSPKQVGALTNWLTVTTGYTNSYAVKTDGTMWGWGSNSSGSLGLGNSTYYSSPKQIGSLTNWSKISGGKDFLIAVKTDGTLWAWGYNGYGMLGLNNITNYSSPKQVGALTNWAYANSSVSNGVSAVKTDGTLWGWGDNTFGQTGTNNTTRYTSPVQVGALTNWAYTTGGMTVLAIKTSGQLWSWGRNDAGQLGLGDTTTRYSPNQVGALTNWSNKITSSIRQSSIAVKTDGTLWTWGKNQAGQLGQGNTTYLSSPKQVGALTTWLNVSSGYSFTMGIALT